MRTLERFFNRQNDRQKRLAENLTGPWPAKLGDRFAHDRWFRI